MAGIEAAQRPRILVLTRSYPEDGNLYQYPFVHRRVLAYRAAGHDVLVFRQGDGNSVSSHGIDGVECVTGGPIACDAAIARFRPHVIAAHGFCETMWPMLEGVAGKVPVRAWLHGSEIPAFFRAKAQCIADSRAREHVLATVELRHSFWRDFLAALPDDFGLVFVSNSAVDLMREDVGALIDDADVSVIPNPIDTDLFAYRAKSADERFAVLSIRPFDSPTYGNDMTVAAICSLAKRDGFGRMRFTIIGDGPLFEDTLAPLAGLANVTIQRRFIDQREIAAEHARHGIFLVPTRLDTQGVSRDEAMASGLVPVTNRVSAVTEFVDESCAALARADDSEALADALWAMVGDPELFMSRSAAAAARVRRQSGQDRVIPAELALLADAANG
jgi:glycosyltransferase involved in cell wall biosynthesis